MDGGLMLSAMSFDGNKGIFLMAFAIVNMENRDNLTVFL